MRNIAANRFFYMILLFTIIGESIFPLYCPKCKQETLIEAKKLQVTVIEDIDKKRRNKGE